MKPLLNRFGAPGAFLNLALVLLAWPFAAALDDDDDAPLIVFAAAYWVLCPILSRGIILVCLMSQCWVCGCCCVHKTRKKAASKPGGVDYTGCAAKSWLGDGDQGRNATLKINELRFVRWC